MNDELMKAVERAELRGGPGDEWVRVEVADWQTIDAALRDLEAENARLREWRGLVGEHNATCEAACDMDRCGYRPYFDNNGRRCSECPHHNVIDIPAHLGADHEA